MKRVLEGEVLVNVEMRRQRKDGSWFDALLTASPVRDAKGQVIAAQSIIKDLTERKRMEKELLSAEKFAALGQMASTLAHEIHNPMAGMRGALEVVRSGLEDEHLVQAVDQVIGQTDRLSRTTKALFSFARPATPQMVPTDLAQLIAKVRFLIEEQAIRQQVEIVEDLEPLGVVLALDPDLTMQAFLNITLNALQIMDRGGTLTITSRRLPEEGTASVGFADTGEGIAPEVLEKVFTPFFTTKMHGTGLGLNVAKDIIEQQGGTLSVESPPGCGTLVTVKLPVGGEGGPGVSRP
jgi:signal transduction histidine kinase